MDFTNSFLNNLEKYFESKEFKRYLKKRSRINTILNARYTRCDEKGHLNPNLEDNSCSYCYRRLKYSTPIDDAITESRKNLSIWEQPCDLPIRMENRKLEISIQEMDDNFKGFKELSKKLEELGI